MTSKVKEAQKEYKKTELGEIPANWEVKKLIELSIGKGEYGIGASAVDYCVDKPRYLRITDIDEMGRLSNNDIRGFDSEIYDNYVLQKGDILFARTGNTTGKSYLYKESDGQLVFAGFLIRFRINRKIADERYVFHYVRTKGYWDWVKKMSTRSGQPGINSNQYSELLIPLPKLREQQKIAEILSIVDKQIDKTDQLIEKTKELKKGLMQQLLTRGIGHTKFKQTKLGEIPIEWDVENLGDIGAWAGGGTPSKSNKEYWSQDKDILWVSSKDMHKKLINDTENYITSEGLKEKKLKLLPKGTILFVMRSGILRKMVPVAIAVENLTINQDLKGLVVNKDFYSNFVLFFLELHNQMIKEKCVKTGTTVESVDFQSLKNISIIKPSLEEQKQIAEVLSTVNEQIENYEQEKEKYTELKKGLIQQLLTGKIRVTV